jgi:hypothetical protein
MSAKGSNKLAGYYNAGNKVWTTMQTAECLPTAICNLQYLLSRHFHNYHLTFTTEETKAPLHSAIIPFRYDTLLKMTVKALVNVAVSAHESL